tara:strand:- start:794 stop:895 length:102 start_codon:yes stop_codon:yes gene_type:complete
MTIKEIDRFIMLNEKVPNKISMLEPEKILSEVN